MSTPLVSVIIPCKNAAPWLGQAIESCLAQSWPRVEVIVVDNGSGDASRDIARRFAGRLALIECAVPGASAARNTGLDHARGDFIQFLDADDVLDDTKIARQMRRLAEAPRGAIASGAWGRFRDDPREARFVPEPVWCDLAPEAFLTASWCGGGMMAPFAWLAPRAVIDAAGRWDETLSLNDDGEFFCRVVLASSGIVFCDDARGFYRTGAGMSLSSRRDPGALGSAYRAIELSSGHLLARHPLSATARAACAALYQRFIYDTFPLVPDLVSRAETRVAALGGSDLTIAGGRLFKSLSRCIGWKAARRCQLGWRELIRPAA
jgi:glycosyltransferase involved in cell wall biosynthesis